MPVVALVGYTNAGKSSLLNAMLTDDQEKHVFEKDMLFATLDTSVRRVEWKKNLPFLMADTVGFVSKLPTHLVKAFRSTWRRLVKRIYYCMLWITHMNIIKK